MNQEIVLKARLLDAQDATAQLTAVLQQIVQVAGVAADTKLEQLPAAIAEKLAPAESE